jgi:hypothetical protein
MGYLINFTMKAKNMEGRSTANEAMAQNSMNLRLLHNAMLAAIPGSRCHY